MSYAIPDPTFGWGTPRARRRWRREARAQAEMSRHGRHDHPDDRDPRPPFPPGFPGGPGFGPGGPGFGPGWRRGRRGGRAGRGDTRTAVLALLAEGPRHGYQLIQEITERSGGAWRPSPGSIYPALSVLQDEGLVDDEKIDGKRVFTLTEAGRSYVAERTDEIAAVFAANSPADDGEAAELRQAMVGLGGAAMQVATVGTAAQQARAAAILNAARKGLYQMLAEDDVPGDDAAAGPSPA